MIVSLEVSCTVQWRVNKARFRFCLLFGLVSWTTCISAASWPPHSCCRKKWGCPTRERRFALMIKFYFVQTLSSLNCMLWRNAKRDRVQHSGCRTQSVPYSSHNAEQQGRGGGSCYCPTDFFLSSTVRRELHQRRSRLWTVQGRIWNMQKVPRSYQWMSNLIASTYSHARGWTVYHLV